MTNLDIFSFQTAGTLILYASVPLVYLLGYTYFAFMEDPDGKNFQVSYKGIEAFKRPIRYILFDSMNDMI